MAYYQADLPGQYFCQRLDDRTGVATVSMYPEFAGHLRLLIGRGGWDCVDSPDESVADLRRFAYHCLPNGLLRLFNAIRSGVFAPTALVVEGLPSDPVQSAPALGEAAKDFKPTNLSETLLVMLGSLVGEPYGVVADGANLVNDLIPTLADRERLTGNGSEKRLGFHTENAVHRWLFRDRDLSPHSLMLTGVAAPDSGAPRTLVANGRIAVGLISEEDRRVLRSPCVELALPLRQRRGSGVIRALPSPVLTGVPGAEHVTAAFYGDMMQPINDRVGRAVNALEAALESCSVGLTIVPGMLVYIPNSYTLHARDAFAPQFDEMGRAKRWLQRIFLTARLDAFQEGGDLRGRVFALPDMTR